MMWSVFGIHWIWMVLFWALVIGAIVWAVGRLAPPSGRDGGDARRILDERYARGELSTEEYRRLRRELES